MYPLGKGGHPYRIWHCSCSVLTLHAAIELKAVFDQIQAAEKAGNLSPEEKKRLEEQAAEKGIQALFKIKCSRWAVHLSNPIFSFPCSGYETWSQIHTSWCLWSSSWWPCDHSREGSASGGCTPDTRGGIYEYEEGRHKPLQVLGLVMIQNMSRLIWRIVEQRSHSTISNILLRALERGSRLFGQVFHFPYSTLWFVMIIMSFFSSKNWS